jgi:hypothetical protein
VGCSDPYIWWAGRAVRDMAATQPKQHDLLSKGDHRDDDGDLGEFV